MNKLGYGIEQEENEVKYMAEERHHEDLVGFFPIKDSDMLGVYVKRKSDKVLGRVLDHFCQGDGSGGIKEILVLKFADKTTDTINLTERKIEYKPYARSIAKKDKYLFKSFNGKWVCPDNWNQTQYINGKWMRYVKEEWIPLEG